jgi:hypothetical protein
MLLPCAPSAKHNKSGAVAAFEFVKAQLTGEKPNLGENRKVTVSM